MVVPQIAECVL